MTIYILLVVTIGFFGVVLKAENSLKNKKVFLWISFIALVIVSSVRGYTVGADTTLYVDIFEQIDIIAIVNARYEAGFILYLKILDFFCSSPRIMLVVSSSLCIGLMCIFVYYHSKKPVESIMLYIMLGSYFSQMNIMRQVLAMSIAMIGFSYMLRNRYVLAGCLILSSCFFHTSGLVAFVPYIIWVFFKERIFDTIASKKFVKWFFLICVCMFVCYPSIITLVQHLFPQYALYFNGAWGDSNYFASLLNTVVVLAFLFTGLLCIKGKKFSKLQAFAFLMLCFQLVFSVLSMRMEIWNRLIGVFDIYLSLVWVPEILYAQQSRNKRMITKMAIICGSAAYMLIILIYRPEWTNVVPYVLESMR